MPQFRSAAQLRFGVLVYALACTTLAAACAEPVSSEPSDAGDAEAGRAAPDAAPPDSGISNAWVEIGVPAGSDGLDFEALEPGADLRLQTFGQGGSHLNLAVRCHGFGSRAFVTITLRNQNTGAEAVSPPPVRPQLLFCHDDHTCDLVPLLAMTGGLFAPEERRDGLPIEITAHVENEAGVEAEATQEATLSTADL